MSNDTASVPGQDLRDLGIDAPDMEPGLLVVWAAEEWARLCQLSLFTSAAYWLSIGRGPGSPGGHRRAQWMCQRAGENVFMPPLATSCTSADQLLVRVAGEGLELHNVGRHPMYVDGQQVARATVKPGQLVYLTGQFILKCVLRPLPMPPPRHMQPQFMGAFGLPNAFGTVGESPLAVWLLEQAAFAAKEYREHVLIHGDSGTGKEAIAKMIHVARRDGPLGARLRRGLGRAVLRQRASEGGDDRVWKREVGVVGQSRLHGLPLLDLIGDVLRHVEDSENAMNDRRTHWNFLSFRAAPSPHARPLEQPPDHQADTS